MASIFLSYGRDDDEPFVKQLYEDMVARGFSVWWDRVDMPSRGLEFPQELRLAIMEVDRLVLVVGPAAMESQYVRDEWQWALEIGVVVNPVLRMGAYSLLPPELNFDTPDFTTDAKYRAGRDKFFAEIAKPPAPMGDLLHGVPPLPPNFIPRPDLLGIIKQELKSDLVQPIAVTGKVSAVGLPGQGGIGKSVLASLAARLPEIRRAFPDGILWATIGRNPTITSLQAELARELGDLNAAFNNVQQGRSRLSKLLEPKKCLLILDDVWDIRHAAPFRDLGPWCKMLVTSRNHEIIRCLGARECRVDVLRPADALALLAKWAGVPVDSLPPEAAEVVHQCGYLPLAVAMAGAMVGGAGYVGKRAFQAAQCGPGQDPRGLPRLPIRGPASRAAGKRG